MMLRVVTAFLVATGFMAVAWSESPPQRTSNPISLDAMHDLFVADFLNSEGFGPNRIPKTEAPPKFEPPTVAILGQRFTVKSRELIGIVKHDPPVVHQQYDHAVMSGANKPPESAAPQVVVPEQNAKTVKKTPEKTRRLTKFERAALTLFRNGGELSYGIQGADRVVVGPIRATAQCMKCHENSKEGEILGALTYRLSAIEDPLP